MILNKVTLYFSLDSLTIKCLPLVLISNQIDKTTAIPTLPPKNKNKNNFFLKKGKNMKSHVNHIVKRNKKDILEMTSIYILI